MFACTTSNLGVGDICIPDCDEGYILENPEAAMCLSTGTWNKTTTPICEG